MKRYVDKSIKKFLFIGAIAIQIVGCGTDEMCEYDRTGDPVDPCVSFETNNESASMTVATCYSRMGTEPVAVIFDTSLNSQAPLGEDWGTTTAATPVPAIHPVNWTLNDIGQVFGIAIDDQENIFLASSDVYYFPSVIASSSSQQAQLYKCSPTSSYNAVPFLTFTGDASPLNDLGNVAYDKVNNQLFVTNLDDGTITRVTGLGTAAGVVEETFNPWAADSPGIESQAEQVWGVGVNYEGGTVKVYFPRVSSTERSIYSVTLDASGAFPTTPAVLEITGIPGDQDIISDIAFSSDFKKMLIAERGNPHLAKVLSYNLSGTTWVANLQYFVGGNAGRDGENSAGGVDFSASEVDGNISAECNSLFYVTGNYMFGNAESPGDFMYGIQGIDYNGNNSRSAPFPTANQDTDIFIDLDGDTTGGQKFEIGDVEVFDASECIDLCNF